MSTRAMIAQTMPSDLQAGRSTTSTLACAGPVGGVALSMTCMAPSSHSLKVISLYLANSPGGNGMFIRSIHKLLK